MVNFTVSVKESTVSEIPNDYRRCKILGRFGSSPDKESARKQSLPEMFDEYLEIDGSKDEILFCEVSVLSFREWATQKTVLLLMVQKSQTTTWDGDKTL